MNLEIKIEKIAFGGDGIGTVDGKTCFVEGVLPGEVVIASVLQDKKNFLKAKAIKIVEASPFRVVPPCPYVERCGGCQYQHTAYEEELRIKESQVCEMIERGLGISAEVVRPIVRSPKEYAYRNSMTLHRSSSDSSKPQRMGFVGHDNKTVTLVENCLIGDERLSGIFSLPFRLKKGVERVSFKLSSSGQVVSDFEEMFIRVKIGGQELLVNSQGFFQNNLGMTEIIAKKVASWVEMAKPDIFYDLYAGVGTFSFLSAASVSKHVCVEESKASLSALRMNAMERGKKNFEIIQGMAEKVFPQVCPKEKAERLLVCLDPPRQGIERSLAEFLSEGQAIDGLVYVSCDPATLVRDLKVILSRGRFKLEEAVPFDMFPKTKHIETAVFLAPRK